MSRKICRFHPNETHTELFCPDRHDAGDPRSCGPRCEGPHGYVPDSIGAAGDYTERSGISRW